MSRLDELCGHLLRCKVSDVTASRKYAAGLTIRSIAWQLKVSYGAVRNALKRAGVVRKPRGGRKALPCLNCGRLRCVFHKRVRRAAWMRDYYQRKIDGTRALQ